MSYDILKILTQYWGFSSFRSMQEDIIHSVLDGNDTLALLPTGGGKSICFQVPALALEGVCIVVTPLISLMKDQVENLKQKGIRAAAVYSGMHPSEIDIIFDNAAYGDIKLLYLSPERLETETFRERVQRMNVNLLAIDEAHCISQWGYDFRPPYLNIAAIREIIPQVPVLALTATATPLVVKDIQDKLNFSKECVFQKSFERKNLAYVVLNSDDKLGTMLRILNNVDGPGVVYVRNRRKTKEIAEYLQKNNIPADYYHAGLEAKIRSEKQDAWMDETCRIIVATNAFGMGIDKPNVRTVIHLDLTDSVEAYFQEAGRAGRDEKKSFAVLVYNEADITNSREQFNTSYPELETIRKTYQSLGNYYQLATGSGKDLSFDFELKTFAETYKIQPLLAFNAMKILEKEGYIMLSETIYAPSRIHFKYSRDDLYRFQVENPAHDNFIKLLLRSYTGLFGDFVRISETEIARRLSLDDDDIIAYLKRLNEQGVISYIPSKNKPQLIFVKERQDSSHIHISPEEYHHRKTNAANRLQAVMNYLKTRDQCRSQQLLEYFGEKTSQRCGKCDVCQERNKMDISDREFERIKNKIRELIQKEPQSLQEIAFQLKTIPEERIISVLRWLEDNDRIHKNEKQQYSWRKQFKLMF